MFIHADTTTTTRSITTLIIATSSAAGIVLVLLGLIVTGGICLAVYMRKKPDISHIYEIPTGGSTNPHFAMSTSISKVPDVLTQNSAYGQRSTCNDGNQEYENIATDFRTLDSNV